MRQIIRTTNTTSGTNSNDRVKDQGEVYTPDNIVLDMLKLTQDAYEKDSQYNVQAKDKIIKYIDLTWLEPSCGNGNFLVRIIDHKLKLINILLKLDPEEIKNKKYWLLRAASHIYGIDILYDNVENSINRMLEVIFYGNTGILSNDSNYKAKFYSMDDNNEIDLSLTYSEFENDTQFREALEFILTHNIQMGNTLTYEAWDSSKAQAAINNPLKELYTLNYLYNGTDGSVVIEKEPFKNSLDNSKRDLETINIDNIFNITKYKNSLDTPKKSDDSIASDSFDF